MSKVQIICDIGSTHGNHWKYLQRAIGVAADLGVTLKVQLFGEEHAKGGNIMLDMDLYERAVQEAEQKGVLLFPSVFDYYMYSFAKSVSTKAVKFAYSMRKSELIKDALEAFDTVYVSMQHLDLEPVKPANMVRLLCIPEYPVYSNLELFNCFPPFDGFSDHTMGVRQTMYALDMGADVIEKHVRFDGWTDCPDARFAIDEKQLKEIADYAM